MSRTTYTITIASNYYPQQDESKKLDAMTATDDQQEIGFLRWMVELGRSVL